MIFVLVFVAAFSPVLSHSWITCPPSFDNRLTQRGGIQGALCENEGSNTYVTEVHAGDRLKVGWTSNNHAGGYVRLSLVPYGTHLDEDNLKRNTMKFACYGHDTRPHKTKYGDCIHPCDGRPGCEYQSNNYDVNRYDTTIGIPTNLATGYYVLHAAMLVGNTFTPYNSCAKLRIVGGNPNFNCISSQPILTYSCLKSAGPELKGSSIESGTSRGNFCYRLNGEIGSVDYNLRDVPINVDCDPRLSCGNSVRYSQCSKEPGMNSIKNAPINPVQPHCKIYTVIPDAEPTCVDGKKNRDEENVDCGGKFCSPCPTIKYEGDYYSDITQANSIWGSGANIYFSIHIAKDIKKTQCWQLNLQFKVPVSISSNPWFNGILVWQNSDLKMMTFENKGVSTYGSEIMVSKGSNIRIAFGASNKLYMETGKEELLWTEEDLKFITALLEVYDNPEECIRKQVKPR